MDKNYFSEDTIVASATGLNVKSAISVLRVSGENAIRDAHKLFNLHNTKLQSEFERGDFSNLRTQFMYRCQFLGVSGKAIDDGMIVFFRNPNSYTGEDMIEVHLHGNPLIQRLMIDSISENMQARPAEPGEFSFRAFKNGKLDMSQVEAVESLISAETVKGVELAVNSLSGTVRLFIDPIQDELKNLLASLELELDFSDQDVEVLDWSVFGKKLDSVLSRMEQAIQQFDAVQPALSGVKVSFVGRPNSGKSTLFNLLLGEDRSIVSQIKGTTRDVVRENVYFGGLLLKLSDTAGIHDTDDLVENEGIRRSKSTIVNSELILIVIDATDLGSEEGKADSLRFLEEIKKDQHHGKAVVVFNKMDLASNTEFLESLDFDLPYVSMVANEGKGLEDLRELLANEFSVHEMRDRQPEIYCERQKAVLKEALTLLISVRNRSIPGCAELDLLSSDIRSSMALISELSGSYDSEAILNHIFSSFCIGK